jgi:hypothetical protein
MIHDFSGKKNFLPPTQLITGFGYMFKLEESSIARHLDDRKKRSFDETDDVTTEGNLARIFAYMCCIVCPIFVAEGSVAPTTTESAIDESDDNVDSQSEEDEEDEEERNTTREEKHPESNDEAAEVTQTDIDNNKRSGAATIETSTKDGSSSESSGDESALDFGVRGLKVGFRIITNNCTKSKFEFS